MSCCVSFFRWIIENLLLLFNVIFVLVGITALSIGITFYVNLSDYNGFFENAYYTVPILIIVVGSVTLFLASLGLFGTCLDNKNLLKTYMWLMIFVFLGILVVIGIAVYYSNSTKIEAVVHKNLESYFNFYEVLYQQKIDDIQKNLECCGINSSIDYKVRNIPLPSSCCSISNQCNFRTAYAQGCEEALTNVAVKITQEVAIFSIIVALVLIVCIMCVCCIESTRKKILTTV